MVSGDFNGDGIPDLATLSGCNLYPNCTQASLTILLGKGDDTINVLADKAIGPNHSHLGIIETRDDRESHGAMTLEQP